MKIFDKMLGSFDRKNYTTIGWLKRRRFLIVFYAVLMILCAGYIEAFVLTGGIAHFTPSPRGDVGWIAGLTTVLFLFARCIVSFIDHSNRFRKELREARLANLIPAAESDIPRP